MLYKLVLIDDEDWILSGLQNAIDWEEIGFRITGAYTNGKEALEQMIENPPDAILTDIKMPIQDGITMVSELRENGLLDVKVVFLSGYDDFKFAQSSLRLGAIDYILKPSVPEQIIETFRRIKARLDEETQKETEKKFASELVHAGIQVFKDAVYNSVISGNEQQYNRLMSLYYELVEQEKGEKFQVISFTIDSVVREDCPGLEDIEAIQYMKSMMEEEQRDYPETIYLIENTFSSILVLSDYKNKVGKDFVGELRRKFRKHNGYELLYGKSDEYIDFSDIWEAYRSSLERLYLLDMPKDIQQLYFSLENDVVLKAAVEDRDQQVLIWSIKNWLAKIDQVEKLYQSRLVKRLLYGVSIFLLQNDVSAQSIKDFYRVLEEVSCDEIKEKLIPFLKLESLLKKKKNAKNISLCYEVAKYISKNYAEEITLSDLAKRFYISQNYLGAMFKKTIGVGIREYQTNIRLEQADALIASRKFKLYQVAEMVGYSNYEYFRKMYCRYRGKNPSV